MPCSKGMRSCAARCGHRALVEGYRDERRRQWSELIEFTKGYSTEVADRLRELRENGTPLIDYKSWLKQNARPPEDRDMPVPENDAMLSPSGIGDPTSEQILLATVMEHPEHAEYLQQFRPGEFTTLLHQKVAAGIQELDRQGIEPSASTVEAWIRENRAFGPHPDWDSRFYRPERFGDTVPLYKDGEQQWVNRKDLGLRGWHQVAGPGIESVEYYGSVVRDNTILRMTTDAHLWAADRLQEVVKAPSCDIAEQTSQVNWSFQQRLAEQPPPLPALTAQGPHPGLAPGRTASSPAMQYAQAQTVSGPAPRVPAQMVKVG